MSILKFLGSGSAFNTKLGNTSAYYKHGNQMLLIDCGSNIFHRIKESGVLEGVEHIHTLITHTHADHVGSLADLILYTYYSHGDFAKPKVTVISPFNTYVDNILELNGCVPNTHFNLKLIGGESFENIDNMAIKYCFMDSSHVEELHSYSLDLIINENLIHYSGDSNDLKTSLKSYTPLNECYSHVYIDTCKADYDGNVHLSLRKLTELVPKELRNKVYCMHLDEGFVREEAEGLGFNVVENEF